MLNNVIDLSHHQSHVDFNKIKAAGIVGVIHKATQGLGYTDPRYKARKKLAREAGLLFGAYHFGTGGDGSDQADHFLQVAEPDDQTLLVLDFEPNPRGTTMKLTQAQEFVSHLHAVRGRFPGFYTGAAAVGPQLVDPLLGECWLWWAQYGLAPSRIPTRTWKTWTMWQYTDGAVGPQPRSVDGVGFCDRNKFNGDLTGLGRLWNTLPATSDDEAESKRVEEFLPRLTELSRELKIGIAGEPTLFMLEDVDQDRTYSLDPQGRLIY